MLIIPKYEDLTGKRFNRITVIKHVPNPKNTTNTGAYWQCKCDCGKEKIVSAKVLKAGQIVSCGCHRRKDNSVKNNPLAKALYHVYHDMKRRCYNEDDFSYQWYGAKGISICEEWIGDNGFRKFEQWAYENGYRKGLSIDRIDTYGNYEPSNCRWVTMKVQQNNKTTTKYVTYKGVTLSLAYWADYLGIPYETLYARLAAGWNVRKAFETSTENIKYVFNGENHTISEWSEITGIREDAIRTRIARGWTIEKVLTQKYKQKEQDETIEYMGENHTIKEWSYITNIPRSTIYSRLRSGKELNEVFKRKDRT